MRLLGVLHILLWFCLLFVSAVYDYKIGKIPNKIILTGVAFATVLAALQGWNSFWNAVIGGGFALGVGFLLWKLHIFRAGDAKLLWMTMQFAGYNCWAQHLASIFIAGGVFALYIMLHHGILVQRMKRVWSYLICMFFSRKFSTYTPIENDTIRFPFAVAILLGEIYMWIVRGVC